MSGLNEEDFPVLPSTKKLLMLIALLIAPGVGARAEIFRPPLASGRGFHRQIRSPDIGVPGNSYAGHVRFWRATAGGTPARRNNCGPSSERKPRR